MIVSIIKNKKRMENVMIRHICMFQLKEENKESHVKEFLERAQSLRGLKMMEHFEAVANAPEAPSNNFDVSLICDFASIEALNQYQVSPEHIEFGKFVASVKKERACIDYQME